MKKWALVFASTLFLAACSGKEEAVVATQNQPTTVTQEQPQAQQNLSCTINGHDCWEIIQLLKNTDPVYSTVPETEMYSPDVESFKNPALEAKGFSVGYYNNHSDGGITASVSWGEADFINIGTHYTDEGPNFLLVWSDGTQKELDPKGHLVNN